MTRRIFILCMSGSIAFFILSTLAMTFYPGGSLLDRTATEYSFWNNFYSELGRTLTASGRDNMISCVLFNIGLAWIGITTTLFFAILPKLFRQSEKFIRIIARIGSVLGMLGTLCYVGVALTPMNLYLNWHNLFVMMAFGLYFFGTLFHAISIFRTSAYPNAYAWFNLTYDLLLLIYVGAWIWGPGQFDPKGLLLLASLQKVLVLTKITNIFLQARGALRLIR